MSHHPHALLIWEIIPESADFYLLPMDVYEQHEAMLREAHGKIINIDDRCDGLDFLNVALCENPEHVPSDSQFAEHACAFRPYKVEVGDAPLTVNVMRVVHSGFLL